MKKVLVGVLAVLLLAECALAEGRLSISFGIPFGDRSRRHHCDQSCRQHRQAPYVGVRYRLGPSIRQRTPSRRPGLTIGYSQWWGRDRQVVREVRGVRQPIRDFIHDLRFTHYNGHFQDVFKFPHVSRKWIR